MVFSGLLLTLDNVQALNMSWMEKQNRKSMCKCIYLKDQLICKNNAPNKKLLSYQNFINLCPLQIIVMYTFWFPII